MDRECLFGRIGAQIEAHERLCSAHRRDQRADAHDVDDAFEVVGQNMQCHFGADMLQRFHLEVGIAHPALDGAKGMLDGLAPLTHLLGMFIEPLLGSVQNLLMLPTGDPPLLARGTLILDSAILTNAAPIAA